MVEAVFDYTHVVLVWWFIVAILVVDDCTAWFGVVVGGGRWDATTVTGLSIYASSKCETISKNSLLIPLESVDRCARRVGQFLPFALGLLPSSWRA